MPVTSRINHKLHLLEHTCRGTLKAQDIVAAFDAAINLPGFERSMSVLWDCRDSRIDARPDEMQALITHVALRREQRGSDYRLAVVAEDTVIIILADIFKALSTTLSFEVKIFQDITTARNWISSTN